MPMNTVSLSANSD